MPPIDGAKCLLECDLLKKINDLKIAFWKSAESPAFVTGDEDGVVSLYRIPPIGISRLHIIKPWVSVESKGGPIQAVQVCDLSRLDSNDIIIADSKGQVTVFHNEQIIYRNTVSDGCITCLEILKDQLGSLSVLAGDNVGHITCFSLYKHHWKIKTKDLIMPLDLPLSVTIESVFAADLMLPTGQLGTLVLAGDNCGHLYIINQGTVVKCLKIPSIVTTMCVGKFVNSKSSEEQTSNSTNRSQVALGCSDGTVFILEDLELLSEEFVNIKVPLSKMAALQTSSADVDILICAGHFSGVFIAQNGQELWQYKTNAWVNSVVTFDLDDDGTNEVILGCSNGEVLILKL